MAIQISGSTIIDDSRNIVNAGNVGIGLTNPSTDLEIDGTTKIKGFVETQSSASSSNNILDLNANNGTVFAHTTTENIGIVSFTGISTSSAGTQSFSVLLTQGATPYNTTSETGIGTQLATVVTSDGVGYSTHIKVGGGTTITLTDSAGALDLLTFIVSYDGSATIDNSSFAVVGFAATDFRGVI